MRLCRARTQQMFQKLYNLFTFSLLIYIIVLQDFFKWFSNNSSPSININPKFNGNTNYFTPQFYVITATYKRYTQKADLTRLAHSFLLNNVKIHWIIVEDTKENKPNNMLEKFRTDFEKVSTFYQPCENCLKIDLLTASTPDNIKLSKDDPNWLFPRGANQRNKGLEFLYEKAASNKYTANKEALLYFADDDNTYGQNLFENLQKLKNFPPEKLIGLIPTGISGGLKWEGPVCDSIQKDPTGQIKSFHTAWRPERPFPIDMASFILKFDQILITRPTFSSKTRRGYLESDFLIKYLNVKEYINKFVWDRETAEAVKRGEQLFVPSKDINQKIYDQYVVGLNCGDILVWHTQTVKPKDRDELRLISEGRGSVELEY